MLHCTYTLTIITSLPRASPFLLPLTNAFTRCTVLKRFKELWGFKGWAATDCALEGLAAFFYHDMIFSGPMGGAARGLPAVAEAEAFLATAVFAETKKLPVDENHPLYKLFPDFVEQLKSL